MASREPNKFVILILGTLALLNILSWTVVYELNRPSLLEVNFFDVGQGDAIFIETPQNFQILIDGGPSAKILEKLGKEIPFYDRTLDLVILTHPDPDHLLGIIDVLKSYKVGLVGFTGITSEKSEFLEWQSQISRRKTPTVILKKGQKVLIGKKVYLEILAPIEDFEGREVKDFNSSSIVAKLVFADNNFLFTGDTPKSVEKELVDERIDLDSDILKVGHHGSKTSTSEIFLAAVTPEVAVIQVGSNKKSDGLCDDKVNNRYGHPHCEVLERLEKYGIRVLRTDQLGDIKIISDGRNYIIK